ncbi:hypothetical protein [Streptomyces sp. NPDC088261]|uniref:hypothetical protein n=1 Tax=Streptomyces sp. NPDC088261 TaxID=3365851 RepID=UPI003807AD6B
MSSSEETGPASPPTSASAPAPAPASGPRPPRLTALAALCGLEALALLGAGGYLLVMGLLGRPDSPRQAETGGLTVIVLALLPLLAVRGLLLRRSWSRGPALITQIMALPVAWTLLQSSGAGIPAGVALAAVAVTGLVLLLHPTTTEALGIGARPDDSTRD